MGGWNIIDHSVMPDDESIMYLSQRGSAYAIHVDGRQLMDTVAKGSEIALADLACERVQGEPASRVLVGGLGMGFTLAAALRCVPEDGEVVVAEFMAAVVAWNRGPVGQTSGHPLLDRRTVVYGGDVAEVLEAPRGQFCAILLDVDNGPKGLSQERNGWLYTQQGLSRARKALRPGGVLAIWSAHVDERLTKRLEGRGFEVEVVPFTEPGRESYDGLSTDTLWMARRPLG